MTPNLAFGTHSVQWGDAPSWVAAIGAVIIGTFAFSGWNQQRREAAEQRSRDRRAQAMLVRLTTGESVGTMNLGTPTQLTVTVVVTNASLEPIMDCVQHVTMKAKHPEVAGDVTEDLSVAFPDIGQVPPGESREGGRRFVAPTAQGGVVDRDTHIWVTFVDHNGLQWKRDSLGTLAEVLAPTSEAGWTSHWQWPYTRTPRR